MTTRYYYLVFFFISLRSACSCPSTYGGLDPLFTFNATSLKHSVQQGANCLRWRLDGLFPTDSQQSEECNCLVSSMLYLLDQRVMDFAPEAIMSTNMYDCERMETVMRGFHAQWAIRQIDHLLDPFALAHYNRRNASCLIRGGMNLVYLNCNGVLRKDLTQHASIRQLLTQAVVQNTTHYYPIVHPDIPRKYDSPWSSSFKTGQSNAARNLFYRGSIVLWTDMDEEESHCSRTSHAAECYDLVDWILRARLFPFEKHHLTISTFHDPLPVTGDTDENIWISEIIHETRSWHKLCAIVRHMLRPNNASVWEHIKSLHRIIAYVENFSN